MKKEIILSDIGALLGIAGIIIAILPFFGYGTRGLFNAILPILFGIIGFSLAFKIKKTLNDDITKSGVILNPLAIILGIISFLIIII